MTQLSLHLLGPPEARLEGRVLRFRTHKTLALLALLSLSPQALRREALADFFWGDALDVEGARRELRKTLSYLKAALGDDLPWLTVTRETVEFNRTELASDVDQLQSAAQHVARLETTELEAVLGAYRGEFMLGFEVATPVASEWLRWQRERCRGALGVVAAALVERQMTAGDLGGAAQSAATWVRLDSTSEAAHRALMGVHLASGDHDAVLRAFEACREVLARELEASPGVHTQRVAASARAALSERAPPGLVGREAAWRALADADLAGGLALVCGEPGIGKTRLALEFAAVHGEALVLHAEDSARGVPLEPVALALRGALRDPAQRERLNLLESVWRTEVARLVPEFGDGVIEEIALPTPDGRARFSEGLLRALFAALGPRGVLVLDDLHGFDVDSAALALSLARRVGGLVVACARVPELEANAAVQLALDNFARHRPVTRIALEPLSAQDIAQLVQTQVGLEAVKLHQLTGGNPLYALEAARHPDALEAQQGVLELVRRRVKRLGDGVQRLLEAASLSAQTFTLDAVQRAAGLDERAALHAIEVALEAELIVEGTSTHAFSHGLIRQALLEGLRAERKRRLHRLLALDATEPGRIAEHLEQGGLPAAAIAHRLRAAEQATRLHAYRQAIAHQDQALVDGLDDAGLAAIFEPRYRLYVALADWTGLERQLELFASAAARLGQPALIAFVEMGWTDYCFRVGRYAQGIERATALLRQPLSPNVEAMTRYARGLSLLSLGRAAQAEADFQTALGCAQGDWDLRGWVFNTLAICQSIRGEFAEALSANAQSERWFQRRGDEQGLANAQRVTAPILAHYGHVEHALELLQSALRAAQAINHVFLERAVLETVVKVLLGHVHDAANAGVEQSESEFFASATPDDLTRAEPWLERCWERAQEPFDAFLEPLWRNRLEHARRLLQAVRAPAPGKPPGSALRALEP